MTILLSGDLRLSQLAMQRRDGTIVTAYYSSASLTISDTTWASRLKPPAKQ